MRTVADTTRRFKFTDTRLEAWPTNGGEACLFDESKPGLVLRVRGKSKAFYHWRTDAVTKKTVKSQIGSLGVWTVNQARAEVDKLNGQTAEAGGVVPRKDKPTLITLGDAFANYMEWREASGGHSVTGQRSIYKLYLAKFAHVRMDAIDKDWIERNAKFAVSKGEGLDAKRLKRRRSGGTYTANAVLVLLSAVFNRYLEVNELTAKKINPCRAVKLYPSYRREECLRGDEIRKFMDAIEVFKREHCYYKHTRSGGTKWRKHGMKEGDPIESRMAMADVLFVALISGQRRGAIGRMKWADVDLDGDIPTWRILAIKGNKTKKPKTVFLHPKIVEMLKARRERIAGDYVFPGACTENYNKSPRKVFKMILRIAGINNPRLTVHDLRAAFVTLGIAGKMNLEAISAAVGHDNLSTTQHYARLSASQKYDVATAIGNLVIGNTNEDAA